ncbi:hypothetical protein FALCPG4_005398 [Fusarium falciforme]
MSRWHADTCVSPDVVLNGDLPICNTCGAVPDLGAIRLKQQQTSLLPSIPPNEPPGQFNLYWPLSSLYSHAKTRQGSDADNPNERLDSTDDFEPSPIYHRRLQDHEFRLLRLEAAPSGTDLLHVHLETHDQERFPVYETVSYTWGGENNDNSRCRPVFIGLHWDVLLQTQNCWDMLKFLQPADGLRRLWVDAICINQKDDKEREAQVSKMIVIYQEAQRVVVYLGSSLIDSGSPHKYPLRRKFEHSIIQSNDSGHLVRDGKLDVNKLLARRYFSRLWVVQELIVSRQVVFQVGDTEFWANGATVHQLKGHDWENTSAPWLVHMAQGTSPGGNIYDAMRATWSSKASDPRDKIFGILALIDDRRERELFRPDYSLSFFHIYLGALAYSLLDLKRVEILCHGPSRSAPYDQPSWMIDWNIRRWPTLCDLQDQAELAFKSWKHPWHEDRVRPRRDHLTPAQQTSSSVPFGLQTPKPVQYILSQFSTQYKHDMGVSFDPRVKGIYPSRARPRQASPYIKDLDDEEVQRLKEESWDKGAAVDASTGSLMVNLTRICDLAVVPSKVHSDGAMMVFEVQGAAPNKIWMYLVTDMPLDNLVVPSRDHLFLLDLGDEKSFVVLILRKLDDSPVFRLIGCCYGLYFLFISSNMSAPSRENTLFLSDLRNRLRLNDTTGFIPGMGVLESLPHLQPDSTNERQVSTLVHELLRGSALKLLQAYCECIHPQFHPVVNGEHVEITVNPATWQSLLDSASISPLIEIYTEMRFEETEDWTSSERILHWSLTSLECGELDSPAIKDNQPLHLRVSQDNLHALVERFTAYGAPARYQSRCKSDARFYMPPERIMGEEASMVTCPAWPTPILKGFIIDGRMYRVCIA